MPLRLTVTKLVDISSGILKDNTNKIGEKLSFIIPDSYIISYSEGEVVHEPAPEELPYTLLKDKDGTESIIIMSEGKIANPWRGQNILVNIPGKTNEIVEQLTIKSDIPISPNTIDPISGWNYNTWNIISPVTVGNYTVENVEILSLTQKTDMQYSVLAKIRIVDNTTGKIFGPNFVTHRSGYLLLSQGLNRDGPQEFDLVSGYEMQDAAVILHKIEVV